MTRTSDHRSFHKEDVGTGRGTNLPAVGGFNQAVILDLHPPRADRAWSRVQLAERSGLSSQTVSNITK